MAGLVGLDGAVEVGLGWWSGVVSRGAGSDLRGLRVGFGFWSSVVSSRVRDTRGFGFRFAGVVFAALVLLASCALLCVALAPALPCVRFVCSGRDELTVL